LRFILLSISILMLGCGGSSDQTTTASTEKTSSGGTVGKELPGPCTLLDSRIIADAMGLSPDQTATLSGEDSYGTCSYAWPKPDQDAIDAENAKRMKTYMTAVQEARKNGEDPPKMNMIATDYTISFNYREFDDAARAERALGALKNMMKEGVTAEHDGVKATFRIDYDQEVTGVGEAGMWSSSHNQLAVQHDRLLMYVTLDISTEDAENRAVAEKVMHAIIKKL